MCCTYKSNIWEQIEKKEQSNLTLERSGHDAYIQCIMAYRCEGTKLKRAATFVTCIVLTL